MAFRDEEDLKEWHKQLDNIMMAKYTQEEDEHKTAIYKELEPLLKFQQQLALQQYVRHLGVYFEV